MSRPLDRSRFDFRAFDATNPSASPHFARLVAHLESDGLAAYPTETVYGFGGRPSPVAVARLAALKRRDVERPFLLLTSDGAALPDLVWTDEARALADVFWPGALTLVLADPGGRYPVGVRGPNGGVAVRETAHPLARALAEAIGGTITSTSANAPGAPPAADADGVVRALRALGGDDAAAAADANEAGQVWVADGGPLPPSPPSTLVDCTGAAPIVIRAGSIPLSRLHCVLPRLDARV